MNHVKLSKAHSHYWSLNLFLRKPNPLVPGGIKPEVTCEVKIKIK